MKELDQDESIRELEQQYSYLRLGLRECPYWDLIDGKVPLLSSESSDMEQELLSFKEALRELGQPQTEADTIGLVLEAGGSNIDYDIERIRDPLTGLLYSERWDIVGHTEMHDGNQILVFRRGLSKMDDITYEFSYAKYAQLTNEKMYQIMNHGSDAYYNLDQLEDNEPPVDASTLDHNSSPQDEGGPMDEITPEAIVATASQWDWKFPEWWEGVDTWNGPSEEIEWKFVKALAFLCRGNPKFMDKCYRASGRYASRPGRTVPKWDIPQVDGRTYGEMLIVEALMKVDYHYGGDYIDPAEAGL